MNPLVDRISDAEAEILKVIWEAGEPATYSHIKTVLTEKGGNWVSTTIHTLLGRMVKKDILSIDKKEVYHYNPNVSEQEYTEAKTKTFLQKIYNGSARDLLSALVNSNEVTEEDRDYLREYFRRGGDD